MRRRVGRAGYRRALPPSALVTMPGRFGRLSGPLLMACGLAVAACGSARVGEVPRTSDGELDIEALMDVVEEERGRDFDGDVDVEFVPRDEVPDTSIAEREWILLDLLEIADAKARDEFEQLSARADRITAACCPIVVAEGFDDRTTAVVLVHELTHLLDQSQPWMMVPTVGIETRTYRTAIVEGVAVLIEEAYAEQIGVPSLRDAPRPRAEAADRLIRLLEFPYVGGRDLAARVLADGGSTAIEKALREPPRSSAQVLFPQRYLDGTEPVDVGPPVRPADGLTLREGTLGAFMLALVIEPALGEERARELVEGWFGDSYVLVLTTDETCVSARIEWMPGQDAAALADALSEVLADATVGADASSVELVRCRAR